MTKIVTYAMAKPYESMIHRFKKITSLFLLGITLVLGGSALVSSKAEAREVHQVRLERHKKAVQHRKEVRKERAEARKHRAEERKKHAEIRKEHRQEREHR